MLSDALDPQTAKRVVDELKFSEGFQSPIK